jgi:predicted regulator of Ras-like GTPase activity (Roadblock/LC7/MglB family)
MAVPAAFSDLLEISSQIETAIVLDEDEVVASSLAKKGDSEELADSIRRLVETAERTHAGLRQIEVAVPEGRVFVVREGTRLIAAATAADPPSGLVFYDLRSCLSGLAAETAGKKKSAAK